MGVGAAAGRGGGGGARWAKRPREAGGVRRAAGGGRRGACGRAGLGVRSVDVRVRARAPPWSAGR